MLKHIFAAIPVVNLGICPVGGATVSVFKETKLRTWFIVCGSHHSTSCTAVCSSVLTVALLVGHFCEKQFLQHVWSP